MRKGIGFLLPLVVWASVFWATAPGAASLLPQETIRCLVQGQIEILNPKVKLRDGGADSSGVANSQEDFPEACRDLRPPKCPAPVVRQASTY